MDTTNKGVVFDIQKFSIHDGPGIRTTVFLKGCPLKCVWCHNPESQSFSTELSYAAEKCVKCGACANACPQGCHVVSGDSHFYQREKCIVCWKCSQDCCTDALQVVGRILSVQEVMETIAKDIDFFRNSGGGVTLSGGEPLAQPLFAHQLLKEAKALGINTAVETSGYSKWRDIECLIPFVDIWFWDIKALPDAHKRLTGVAADEILENLGKVDEKGGRIILRCPLVSGLNDSDAALRHIAKVANSLDNCEEINLEPYNPLGESKYAHLGRIANHQETPSTRIVSHWKSYLGKQTRKHISLA